MNICELSGVIPYCKHCPISKPSDAGFEKRFCLAIRQNISIVSVESKLKKLGENPDLDVSLIPDFCTGCPGKKTICTVYRGTFACNEFNKKLKKKWIPVSMPKDNDCE